MTTPPDDRDLREAFAALREEDRATVPEWRAPVERPGRGLPRAARWLAVAAALVAVFQVARPRDPEPVPSLAEWRSPTDFLLRTPGRELLETSPVLGRPYDVSLNRGDAP